MKEKEFWKYDSNNKDLDSYLFIHKLDDINKIAHISVYNINLNDEIFSIGHLPISYESFAKSITKLFKQELIEDDSFLEGYNEWIKADGGVWDLQLKDVIKEIKSTIS